MSKSQELIVSCRNLISALTGNAEKICSQIKSLLEEEYYLNFEGDTVGSKLNNLILSDEGLNSSPKVLDAILAFDKSSDEKQRNCTMIIRGNSLPAVRNSSTSSVSFANREPCTKLLRPDLP